MRVGHAAGMAAERPCCRKQRGNKKSAERVGYRCRRRLQSSERGGRERGGRECLAAAAALWPGHHV